MGDQIATRRTALPFMGRSSSGLVFTQKPVLALLILCVCVLVKHYSLDAQVSGEDPIDSIALNAEHDHSAFLNVLLEPSIDMAIREQLAMGNAVDLRFRNFLSYATEYMGVEPGQTTVGLTTAYIGALQYRENLQSSNSSLLAPGGSALGKAVAERSCDSGIPAHQSSPDGSADSQLQDGDSPEAFTQTGPLGMSITYITTTHPVSPVTSLLSGPLRTSWTSDGWDTIPDLASLEHLKAVLSNSPFILQAYQQSMVLRGWQFETTQLAPGLLQSDSILRYSPQGDPSVEHFVHVTGHWDQSSFSIIQVTVQ